jgi:hypothetical protein
LRNINGRTGIRIANCRCRGAPATRLKRAVVRRRRVVRARFVLRGPGARRDSVGVRWRRGGPGFGRGCGAVWASSRCARRGSAAGVAEAVVRAAGRGTPQILVHARAPPESYATNYVGNGMTAPLPPPGWYPDPGGANTRRYFDSTKWTDPEGYTPLSQPPYFGSTPTPPRPRNGLVRWNRANHRINNLVRRAHRVT